MGLVFAGTDPTRADIRSRWREHEAILPAAAILEDEDAEDRVRGKVVADEAQGAGHHWRIGIEKIK